MKQEDFLCLMYMEYGIVPELAKRYITNDMNFDTLNRHDLAIMIQASNR